MLRSGARFAPRVGVVTAILLGTACKHDPNGESGTSHDSTTGSDSNPDSGPDASGWIRQVSSDTATYFDLGAEILTFAVTADSPTGYRDPDGADPLFYVVRSVTLADADTPHPTLLWLHGDAQGIEDDDTRNRACGVEGIAATVENAVRGHPFIAAEVVARQWMWLVPVNSWCDLWSGLGEQDPVDHTHHGEEHALTVLAAARLGFGGMQADSEQIYGWGTSIGAAGILTVSNEDGQFAGVVADSGPVNATSWYELPAETAYLDHILGGSPADMPDVYARVDATITVAEGGYRVPLFAVYNTFDGLVPIRQNEALAAAVDAAYPAAGVRYLHHDVSHHAPGVRYHVQTGYDHTPMSYTNRAAFEFLLGSTVSWMEAETTCVDAACLTVAETGVDSVEPSSAYSGGGAVVGAPETGAGMMYAGDLPASLAGKSVTLLPVIAAADLSGVDASAVVLTLRLRSGDTTLASRTVAASEFAAENDETVAYVRQIDATTWPLDTSGDGVRDALPAGPLRVEVEYSGVGSVGLDGFWIVQ